MRSTSRITIIAALASATALVAAPAFANGSGQSAFMPPWEWYIAAGEGEWGVNETSFNDDSTSRGDAWDDSQFVLFSPDYVAISRATDSLEPAVVENVFAFQCVSTTLTASGDDQVISCDQTLTAPWGLSMTSDVRVLAPGDLARLTVFITNTTTAPVALGYQYTWNYGESTGHVRSSEPSLVQDTGESEGFLGAPDLWSYNFSSLNAGVAWGLPGEPLLAAESHHSGYDNASAFLLPNAGRTIAAGETVAVAFFHKVQEPEPFIDVSAPAVAASTEQAETPVPMPASSREAETPESFMAEFSSFSGRLTRGIPEGVSVGNWQPLAAAEPDPELADTGAGIDEQLLMGGIAAALLGTGAALMAIRRFTVRPARR